jgi:3-phytase
VWILFGLDWGVLTLAVAAVVVEAACSDSTRRSSQATATSAAVSPSVVIEAFLTPALADANIDSVAVWRGGRPALLLATAKIGNTLHVYDAATGVPLRTVGSDGTGPGQLRRPNGILILHDYAFVVERDNHRLQAFGLPDGGPVLVFGEAELRRPYGITGYAEDDGYVLFVTDNYEQADGTYPPDGELDKRVHRFRVSRTSRGLSAAHEGSFGATSGPGVLRKVETIMADAAHRRVLIAEEDAAVRSLLVYTPEGQYTGESIAGWFATEPEGIALYECGRRGYWIATDQHDETARNVFHVFDRQTLEHRGAFRGATTHTTDGIALTRGTLGKLEGGVLYALHNDAQVAAFAWADIATTLSLERCDAPTAELGDTQP